MTFYHQSGIEINFQEEGLADKPMIVLLHGFGGSVKDWDFVANSFKEKYRLIVPRLAHLMHAKPGLKFSEQVEILQGFIATLKPVNEKVLIVGHSYGGALAWGLTSQYPECFRAALYINPMLPFPGKKFNQRVLSIVTRFWVPQAFFLALTLPVGRSIVTELAQIFDIHRGKKRTRLHRWDRRKRQLFVEVMARFSWILRSEKWNYWLPLLRKNQIKSVLLCSQNDPLFDLQYYREFSQLLQNCSLESIEGKSHKFLEAHSRELLYFLQTLL